MLLIHAQWIFKNMKGVFLIMRSSIFFWKIPHQIRRKHFSVSFSSSSPCDWYRFYGRDQSAFTSIYLIALLHQILCNTLDILDFITKCSDTQMKFRAAGLALLISTWLHCSLLDSFDLCDVSLHSMSCESVNCQHLLHINYELIILLTGWLPIKGLTCFMYLSASLLQQKDSWSKESRWELQPQSRLAYRLLKYVRAETSQRERSIIDIYVC